MSAEPSWTLSELVAEVATRIARLPEPRNGQVRAVPDERTVRYYGTLGLLARPLAMRGRTALYGRRHLAQVVAIKRMQSSGRSLADITALWPTLDDVTLQRMSGVEVGTRRSRAEFWKHAPVATPPLASAPADHAAPTAPTATGLRIELAPHVILDIAMPASGIAVSAADIRAIRAAAAPLLTALAQRSLTHPEGP